MSTRRRAHGPIVRAVREALGLRSDTVAADAHISTGYLSNIEAGRRRPEQDITLRIADALGVQVEIITGQRPAIATIRTALHVEPATFAADIGLTADRLDRLERGLEIPDADLLAVIATRLGVDYAALNAYSLAAA